MCSVVQRSLYSSREYHTETYDEGDYGSFHCRTSDLLRAK